MNSIDNMTKIVEQTGYKVIDQQGKNFSNKIKQYAQEYLDIIKRNQEELEELNKILQHEKEVVQSIKQADTNAPYEWRILSQNRHLMTKKDHWREMVTASLKFQNQINELLNQKVELVYVYQDEKNNPVLYTLDQSLLSSALYYQNNKGKIAGRFKQNRNNFLSYLTNLTKYQLYENFNLDYFNYTYKQVIWRFNYGHQKNTDLIMWLNPSYTGLNGKVKWLKASVNKRGDIKEAYASVILDRQINSIKLFNDEKLDNNVHSFMEQVAKVDNESGLLKGDVTVGQIEYAIKGASASTLGLKQIIEVAQTILNKTNYLKSDLKNQKEEFHKKAVTRNHIENLAKKEQEKWQKELQKELNIEIKNEIGMNILIQYQPSDFSWFN